MNGVPLLTAEEFAAREMDNLDGRWTELLAGRIVKLEAPGFEHGAVVLNFSKFIAAALQKAASGSPYACFELGLVVHRSPDTVRRPAVCLFSGGSPFAELERRISETRPDFVLEVASTNDRRRDMRQRVESYLGWGVPAVWVADPHEKIVHVMQPLCSPRQFSGSQSLPGFMSFRHSSLSVQALFAMPDGDA